MEKGYKKIFALFFIVILLTVNFTTVFAEEIKNDDYIENKTTSGVYDNLPSSPEAPSIVQTAYSFSPNCIIKGSYYGMTEISTGLSPEQIININIDGNILDQSLYTVIKESSNSSTIISFDLNYMKTLSIGRHTVGADYIDNNTTKNKNTYFKVEEPVQFSNQCSPECQAQIDELKAHVKDLQTQLAQLQSQMNAIQNSRPNESGSNSGSSNGNSSSDSAQNIENIFEQNTGVTTTTTDIPAVNFSNGMNIKSVQTGDNLKIAMLMVVSILSFCGAILCIKSIRKLL